MHHKYVVGLDIDSRAYFTAATCVISFYTDNNSLLSSSQSVNTPSELKPYKLALLACKKEIMYSSLIIWGTFSSQKLYGPNTRFTNLQLYAFSLTSRQRSILIGILLSDGWKQSRKGWYPRIGLKLSLKHFQYLWLVFLELAPLCSSYPYSSNIKNRGKLHLIFQTRQLNCLIYLRSLFFKEIYKSQFKPVIQKDLYHSFDYIALAHWIKGNGSKHNRGLILCTDRYTIKEVILLMNILRIKFFIYPTLYLIKGNPRIHIFRRDMLKIRPFIAPYFVKSFLYKIYM